MKTKILLITLLKGFSEAIKKAQEYNRVAEAIGIHNAPIQSNPEIVKISTRTPLNYNQAEALYNLSLELGIDINFLIENTISEGIDAHETRLILNLKDKKK